MLRWQKIVVGIEAAILPPLGVSAASAGSNSPQTARRGDPSATTTFTITLPHSIPTIDTTTTTATPVPRRPHLEVEAGFPAYAASIARVSG
jgi:hypothetical protein